VSDVGSAAGVASVKAKIYDSRKYPAPGINGQVKAASRLTASTPQGGQRPSNGFFNESVSNGFLALTADG
jgi:hypothetical protein